VSCLGTNSHAYNEAQNTFDAGQRLWTKGKHNLTFGFQWQSLQDNENTPLTGTQAGFTFSNAERRIRLHRNRPRTTGIAYAVFLLAPSIAACDAERVARPGGLQDVAFYVQDDTKSVSV